VASWGLGLDTCGAWLGLALAPAMGPVCAGAWLEGRQLSESLLPHVAEFVGELPWRELAWVAVVTGPGSFTSLRLGVVVARTLGQQLAIPVFTRSALACATEDKSMAVSRLAHGGRIYGAVGGGQEQLFEPEAWAMQVQDSPQVRVDDLLPTQIVTALTLESRDRYAQGERPGWQAAVPVYLQPFPH